MLILAHSNVYNFIFAGFVCLVKSQTKSAIDPNRCGNGTFYSRDYKMCVPCSTCDVYSTQFSACTSTSDTVCVKCADTSQYDLADHPACLQCPPCQPGEYMETACTSNTSTVCRPCPDGSFNTLASYRVHCFPCTSCENKIMVTDCNASMDTECGACKKGYFRDPHRNRCNRCVSCYHGQVPIKECENGQLGKLCSEYIFSRTEYIDVPLTGGLSTIAPSTAVASVLTSTENISTSASTDIGSPYSSSYSTFDETISPYTSSYSTFDVIIILLVILIVLILCALIVLLKYKLKLLTKSLHLREDNYDNSAMYVDDHFSHTDEVLFFDNLAESTFTNDCENHQYFTNHSSVIVSQKLTHQPDESNSNIVNGYNFTSDNESSKHER